MDNTKELLKNIIEGIQDKKGSNLVVVDLTGIETSICQYFCNMSGKFSQSNHRHSQIGGRQIA